MELWTDQEWWDRNFDKEAVEEALSAAGIKVTGWINRKPNCGPKQMERVQQIIAGQVSSPKPIHTEVADSLPDPPTKKKVAPTGKKGVKK